MWKPTTLEVQDNSRNIVYPEAVRVRILNRVRVFLLVCIGRHVKKKKRKKKKKKKKF